MGTQVWEPTERIGLSQGSALIAFLQANRGAPVRLSLRHQRRTDSRVVQALLVAANAWADDGVPFEVTDVPALICEDFNLLGVTPDMLSWSEME